jgi:hypothetical protein
VIVPPLLGEVKTTLIAVELNTDTVPIIGVSVSVVTEDDAIDGVDVPPELVAVTMNVYSVFGVNPDTVIGDDVPVPVKPELLVTV